MDSVTPETAEVAQQEARKQGSTDVSPVADIASAAGDGGLGAVVEGIGAVAEGVGAALGGAVEAVGSVLGAILPD